MTLAAAFAAAGATVMAADDIKVYVNGAQLEFDVPPMIENERTLVPMRVIFEALGATVDWEQESATVTATRGEDTLKITIGSDLLYKNDTATELDVPAKIVDERTLVPVRAISESFDAKVEWDGETRSVYITTAVDGDALPFYALSEEDMKILAERKEIIRYSFEQQDLPGYALSEPEMYEKLDAKAEAELKQALYNVWTETAAEYIMYIQINSDTVYDIDIPDEVTYAALLEGYDKLLKAAGMDAESMFDGVYLYESGAGTRVAVMAFKSADSLVQSKYLGIAASKGRAARYFTAENDIMQEGTWFFCEVTEEARGTIAGIKKTDDETDLKAFADLCEYAYENDLDPQAALKINE